MNACAIAAAPLASPLASLRSADVTTTRTLPVMADGSTATRGFSRVLVPTDLGPEAIASLAIAIGLTDPEHGRIVLYHARGPQPQRDRPSMQAVADAARAAQGEAAQAIAIETIEDGAPTVAGILAHADAVDLVVMPTHGGQLLAGGIAERIVAAAPCPVLVLHGAPRISDLCAGPWLVAVDGSDASRRAIAAALRITGRASRLVALHATESAMPTRDALGLPQDIGEVATIADAPIAAILGEARARNVAAIAVGRRGRPDRDPLEIGHVPLRLVRSARVPVLVTP